MARIRSVHPGLFTDDAFMALSDAAQVFLIGIWTECDDQGVFDWKPLTLRARLRPARDGSVEPYLAELEAANCIKSYELDGHKRGAVRNFRRFQRPKKPNSLYLLPDELRTYVGLTGASTKPTDDEEPPVSNQLPTGSELSPQMEDGGDKMEDEGGEESSANADSPDATLADVEISIAVLDWNKAAAELKLSRVQHLTATRKRKLPLRLKELGGIDGWSAMIEKIRGSPFLKGDNTQGWKVTFDWVLEPANLAKIMEGNYDHKRNGTARRTLADDAADVGGWLREREEDPRHPG